MSISGIPHAAETLSAALGSLPSLPASSCGSEDVLILVNLINGYCRTGTASFPEALALVPALVPVVRKFPGKKIFVGDKHSPDASEFSYRSPHCADAIEIMTVDELIDDAEEHAVYANSENGFFSIVRDFPFDRQTKHVIIVGVCAERAVLQLALTLHSFFREYERETEVCVLADHLATPGTAEIDPSSAALAALTVLQANGVRLCRTLSTDR